LPVSAAHRRRCGSRPPRGSLAPDDMESSPRAREVQDACLLARLPSLGLPPMRSALFFLRCPRGTLHGIASHRMSPFASPGPLSSPRWSSHAEAGPGACLAAELSRGSCEASAEEAIPSAQCNGGFPGSRNPPARNRCRVDDKRGALAAPSTHATSHPMSREGGLKKLISRWMRLRWRSLHGCHDPISPVRRTVRLTLPGVWARRFV